MSDYIAYHIEERMGYTALDIDKLAVYTSNPTNEAIGSRVWVITGEGTPRKYYLRSTFRISGILPSDNPDFTQVVIGTDGHLFDPMPMLNGEPWIQELASQHGQFTFGFRETHNEAALEGLRNIYRAFAAI